MHEAPTASVVAQEVDTANAVLEVPDRLAAETLNTVFPVLFRVTDCAPDIEPTLVEANVKLLPEREAAVWEPTPVNVTVLFPALVAKVSKPEVAPMVDGVNVTLAEQFAPAAKVAGQLVDAAKAPVVETPDTVTASLPVLLSVTELAADVVPTF